MFINLLYSVYVALINFFLPACFYITLVFLEEGENTANECLLKSASQGHKWLSGGVSFTKLTVLGSPNRAIEYICRVSKRRHKNWSNTVFPTELFKEKANLHF
jgi:hypothetical protein